MTAPDTTRQAEAVKLPMDERKAFEQWYEADAMPQESDWFRKHEDGEYEGYAVASAWDAWQARAALQAGSASRSEPVAWAIESNISIGVRQLTSFCLKEEDADKWVKSQAAEYSGSNRKKIPLYTAPQSSNAAMPAQQADSGEVEQAPDAEQGVGMVGQVPVAYINANGNVMSAARFKEHEESPEWKWVIEQHWQNAIPLFAAPLPPTAIKEPVDPLQAHTDLCQENGLYEMEGNPLIKRDLPATNESAGGLDSAKFNVRVSKMRESHRETYWVVLENTALRPADPKPFDDTGTITPYFSEVEEQAKHTAKEWAEFLGVPDQATCNCIMCERPTKHVAAPTLPAIDGEKK